MMIDRIRAVTSSASQTEQVAFSTEAASSEVDQTSKTPGALSVDVRRELPGFTLDISFRAPRGLTVLFGPSGAGKSLTLQSIAGLFALDSARIALDGIVWHDSGHGFYLPPQRRHVGYVPQNYALFPHLTVEQNIAFGLKERDNQRVSELVELMQLDGLEGRRPAQLSGGQQQRVALARALAPDPLLLLLDEPFSSLDAAVRETLREEMRALHERVHVPIVLVTHDAAEARMLADTVVVIQQGNALQVGSPDDVFRSPRTRAAAALVGMHTCWSGRVVEIMDDEGDDQKPDARRPDVREPDEYEPDEYEPDARWPDAHAPDAHKGHPYMSADHPAPPRVVHIAVEGVVGYGGWISAGSMRGKEFTIGAYIPSSVEVRVGQTIEIGIRTDEIRLFSGEESGRMAAGKRASEMPMTFVAGRVVRDQPKGAFHNISVLLETGQTVDVPMIARELRELGIGDGAAVMVGIPASAVHVFAE